MVCFHDNMFSWFLISSFIALISVCNNDPNEYFIIKLRSLFSTMLRPHMCNYVWCAPPWVFPDGSVGKESSCNVGDTGDAGSTHGLGILPWRRKWQPIPVFLPEKSHQQSSLEGYSPKGHRHWTQLTTKHVPPGSSYLVWHWNSFINICCTSGRENCLYENFI